MSKKEFGSWEQFLWNIGLRGLVNFSPPTSDCPPDRFTVQDKVSTSSPVVWPEGWADTKFDFHVNNGQVGPSGNLRGWPVQRYAPDAVWQNWTQVRYGARTAVAVPVPLDPPLWLEGMPIRGGAWDRHWLGVCPERKEAVEMIWTVPGLRECSGWGRWVDGELVEGRSVCRAGVSLTARLWNRDDEPHLMALHISGSDDNPDTHFEHPTTGDVFRLSADASARLLSGATTDEQRRWIAAATNYGMTVVDRDGSKGPHMMLAPVAGKQWAGQTLSQLDVKISDLELA